MRPLYNLEAEQGLLGAVMADNRAFDSISGILEPEHFGVPVHGRIFTAIRDAITNGHTAAPFTLKSCFAGDDGLKQVGGEKYLAELFATLYSPVNVPEYARLIRVEHERRTYHELGAFLQASAADPEITAEDLTAETERRLTEITSDNGRNTLTAGQAAQSALSWMEDVASGRVTPILTGLKCLDSVLGGLFGGRFYIVAGRPGMGKSSLCVSLADNIAHDLPVLFVSLEMPAQELAMRMVAARTGLSIDEQQSPKEWPAWKWDKVAEAGRRINQLQLTIEDTHAGSLVAIKTLARRHKRRHGRFVLFIDHLGLMQTSKGMQKVHQIEEITTTLKLLAKELDIPIVLLCQLSRAVEGREDKRPMLSDLRDSGSIEQDADVVIFAYREEYYLRRSEPKRNAGETDQHFHERAFEWQQTLDAAAGQATLLIPKNRQGRESIAHALFDGVRQRFEDKEGAHAYG